MKRKASMKGTFGSGNVISAMMDLRDVMFLACFDELRTLVINLSSTEQSFSSDEILRPILRHLVWEYQYTEEGVHYWRIEEGLFDQRDFSYFLEVLKQPEMYQMPSSLNKYSWKHQYYLKAISGSIEALKHEPYHELTHYSNRTIKSFQKCAKEIETELAKSLDPSTLFGSVLKNEPQNEEIIDPFDPAGTILENFVDPNSF